ncbi:MAG: (Fe-S)-binding protein [Alphaproteobacteria bacterium]
MMKKKLNVGFFVTCLVDIFRPSIAFASIELLEKNGCTVSVPESQTCCGQPAFNNGNRKEARRIAAKVIGEFAGFDYVVVPSGSCGGMIHLHYRDLFPKGSKLEKAARELAERTYELVTFLDEVLGYRPQSVSYPGSCAYHDSCAALRELRVKDAPRKFLRQIGNLRLRELEFAEACCGFGGTFCVKFPEVADRIITDKIDDIVASKADTVVSGDLGCLLNIAGKLRREGHKVKVFHVAEILAGKAKGPGIGGTTVQTTKFKLPGADSKL